jgi:hypothetical protein
MNTKAIVVAAVLAAVAGSPALAKSQKVQQSFRQAHAQQLDTRAAVTAPDPIGVYVGGREIGRDPDANIRSSLSEEYYTVNGH